MSPPELFVYYRIRATDAMPARAAFAAACAGRALRLLQRQDGEPGPAALLTWMEIYPAALAALEPAVAAAMAPFVQGARHREAFEALIEASPG